MAYQRPTPRHLLPLREWPIDRRINRTGVGDDDPMTIEPIESDLL